MTVDDSHFVLAMWQFNSRDDVGFSFIFLREYYENLLILIIFIKMLQQKQLGDNWAFVQGLLRVTCRPEVSMTVSYSEKNPSMIHSFIYLLFAYLVKPHHIMCLLLCVTTAGPSRGAGQNACLLLPHSLSAVGAEHQRRLHSVGLLQQESGENTLLGNKKLIDV